jgi:predicted transcriptional regulator
MSTQTNPLKPDPRSAAEQIVAAHKGESAWLDAFTEHLDRHRSGQSLARTLSVWGLSQAETARLLGISRQAVGKWLERGAPAGRIELIGDLAAATDILVHYLKRDRIPAVVRRATPNREGQSLLDLLEQGRSRDLLETCRDMFSFGEAHS